MKLIAIGLLCLFLVGCGAAPALLGPTPKPTLRAIDVYMNETGDYFESLASSTALVKTRIAAEQQDTKLFDDLSWRKEITGALNRIRRDYQTVTNAPPPVGTEAYHNAMIDAEAHTARAADLLLAWLADRDDAKMKQALSELNISEAGLAQAQGILNSLLKDK
jgi:hypothetical protein